MPDWSSKSELPLQNPLNPGYPPRFRRSQTVVAGNSWDFGRRGFWDTPPSSLPSSLECLSPDLKVRVADGLNGLLGMWVTQTELGQICPRCPSKDAFFLHNRSQSRDVQRQDEDICKIEEHPQCVFSILTSSCRGVLTPRYLNVCSFNFPPSLFLFDRGHPSLWTVQILCLSDKKTQRLKYQEIRH